MMTRRVVVTGMGAVTTLGHGRQGLWEGVQRGESAVRSLTRLIPHRIVHGWPQKSSSMSQTISIVSSSNVSTVSHVCRHRRPYGGRGCGLEIAR